MTFLTMNDMFMTWFIISTSNIMNHEHCYVNFSNHRVYMAWSFLPMYECIHVISLHLERWHCIKCKSNNIYYIFLSIFSQGVPHCFWRHVCWVCSILKDSKECNKILAFNYAFLHCCTRNSIFLKAMLTWFLIYGIVRIKHEDGLEPMSLSHTNFKFPQSSPSQTKHVGNYFEHIYFYNSSQYKLRHRNCKRLIKKRVSKNRANLLRQIK